MRSGAGGWMFRLLGVGVVIGVVVCCLVLVPGALAVGDASTVPEEACPNEASPGFRSYLPECRAYELVTPIFKDSSQLQPAGVSVDGSGVLAESLGVFGGAEGDSGAQGAAYVLSRSGSGWGVYAISPPASMFPAQDLVAASPELGETLWLARTPSQSVAAEDFYVHEDVYVREANGAMVKIGSLLPPSVVAGPPAGEFQGFLYTADLKYLDASTDFSHILFRILEGHTLGLLWPGDGTIGVESSLYEYSGRGAVRPELVGVSNEGKLVSTCSTFLGSLFSGDIYNAMSADGSVVFFTAVGHDVNECHGFDVAPEVSELYGRLDRLETVAVSEPTTGQCAACIVPATVAEGRRSAEFAGASQDGSKVFFLTEQELLAGAVGTNLYEYDFDTPAGVHVIQASAPVGPMPAGVQGVARVSEDGSHVYFVAAGRLTSEPRGGTKEGQCYGELTAAEKVEEEEAEKEEAEKAGEATHGGKCRPKEGGDNLYVFERDATYPAGRVSFIATLCSGKEESGSLMSIRQCPSANNDTGDWDSLDLRLVQATPDGRFLVFQSVGDLTEGERDTSAQRQIYEYDAVTGELVRVSRGSDDDQPQGTESANEHESQIPLQAYTQERVSPTRPATRLAVSGDGSSVVFGSGGALTGEAEGASDAGAESVYEYHSTVGDGGLISDGDVYLISDGVNTVSATVEGLDVSGGDVFFTTADRLVPQDSDTQYDVYDARVDGGFGGLAAAAGCVAEACNGSLYVQPSFAMPGITSGGVSGVSPPGVTAAGRRVSVGRGVLLARALRVCRRERRHKRVACEAAARRRYGVVAKAKTRRRGK